MKEVHLTNASIPGVRCLREMKASTNKRRRDTTYTCKMITKIALISQRLSKFPPTSKKSGGNRKAIPVRTAEETRHSKASALEGKSKYHPTQCIPPNTTPTTGIQMRRATIPSESESVPKKVGTFISPTSTSESSVANTANHLMHKTIPEMVKTRVRRIEKVRAKMNGIIIVPRNNIKTWLRKGRDCTMVICRRPFVVIRVKASCNQFTLYHWNASTSIT